MDRLDLEWAEEMASLVVEDLQKCDCAEPEDTKTYVLRLPDEIRCYHTMKDAVDEAKKHPNVATHIEVK